MNQLSKNYFFFLWQIALLNCAISVYVHATLEISETTFDQNFQHLKTSEMDFTHFRRHPLIIKFIDNTTYEMGLKYVHWLRTNTNFIHKIEEYRLNDIVGLPLIYQYDSIGDFCPTTLQYVKIAYEIQSELGDLSNKHILEIGGGYGGLCRILALSGGFSSYTIVNSSEYNELAKYYLDRFGFSNIKFIDQRDFDQISPQNYDCVISNYTFSQFEMEKQNAFIDKLIKHISMGYFNYENHSISTHSQIKDVDYLISVLLKNGRQGRVQAENPPLYDSSVLLTWKTPNTDLIIQPFQQPILVPSNQKQTSSAITYTLSGGRLGDNLLAYLHAKWMSYKLGLPLLYIPFPQSDQFMLHYIEQMHGTHFVFEHYQLLTPHNMHEMNSSPQSICWVIPYFPESLYEFFTVGLSYLPYFKVDWNDRAFQKIIKEHLSSYLPIQPYIFPKDRVMVAVHVRRTGEFDFANINAILPLKFPPDRYYIEQISRLASIYGDKKICIYIFTDDPNPNEIIKHYQGVLQNPRLLFICRKTANSHQSNVFEDFFGMSQFDCLIRPASNFSIVAAKLANYQIEIAPSHFRWHNGSLLIENVDLYFSAP